ncbi:MAG: hypothetical protein PVI90_00930 [Desulfobacteraceae bacterium]|jgi:hypothetical protein
MTFEEFKKLIPGAFESEWHRHPDGGGWVENSAKVEGTVLVGKDAQVYGEAQVYGFALVYGNAKVHENAQVYGNAKVYGDAEVYGDAWVYGNAWICGNAKVFGDTEVYGYATVKDGNWNVTPFQLHGSKHFLCVCAPRILKIGCIEKNIDEWLKMYERTGRTHGYSDEEIEEYGGYIKLVNSLKNSPNVCGLGYKVISHLY